jgi:hypothetical protein
VVNRNEELTTRRLQRTLGKTPDIAGKIDGAHPEAMRPQGLGEFGRQHPVEGELGTPAGADCAAIGQAVTDIHRHCRRLPPGGSDRQEKDENQEAEEKHGQIIPAI